LTIAVWGSARCGSSVVLSALAVHAGEALSADQLAEASWGETPPASWPEQIQGSVLRLRRMLRVAAIETTAAGYRLTVAGDELDSHRFEAFDRPRAGVGGRW
jgi:DNA-binding SARP family transcriptional activator